MRACIHARDDSRTALTPPPTLLPSPLPVAVYRCSSPLPLTPAFCTL
ncbi:hypothetical protein E2C01_073446 [Portunus trituberculatus]|uniref:Uncharacterized protein n=1 Tax=Portunus trituberculatus TaxID=210409 RepID=A0A5B7IBQ2_PORTR|nr:hypothetical protein [Portunus trituberculatus]